jgi:hypothetical protein
MRAMAGKRRYVWRRADSAFISCKCHGTMKLSLHGCNVGKRQIIGVICGYSPQLHSRRNLRHEPGGIAKVCKTISMMPQTLCETAAANIKCNERHKTS